MRCVMRANLANFFTPAVGQARMKETTKTKKPTQIRKASLSLSLAHTGWQTALRRTADRGPARHSLRAAAKDGWSPWAKKERETLMGMPPSSGEKL